MTRGDRTAAAVRVALMFVLAASWLGCSRGPSIRAVVQNPSRFQDSVVTLSGTAVGPQGVSLVGLGVGLYTLVDGVDSIKVVAASAPPADQQRVRVTGRVRAALGFGVVRIGPVVEESAREAR